MAVRNQYIVDDIVDSAGRPRAAQIAGTIEDAKALAKRVEARSAILYGETLTISDHNVDVPDFHRAADGEYWNQRDAQELERLVDGAWQPV